VHELSIAESLIESVEEEAGRRGAARVVAIYLKVGALSGVVKDALLFSFDVAAHGTIAEDARLVVEEVPTTIYCAVCRTERELTAILDLCCPFCGTPSPDVRRGRELEFVAMEIAGGDADR
jgi:hydrogenase nickel incorporation protein HypA/HybF